MVIQYSQQRVFERNDKPTRVGAVGCGVMQSALRLLNAVLHKRSLFGRAFAA